MNICSKILKLFFALSWSGSTFAGQFSGVAEARNLAEGKTMFFRGKVDSSNLSQIKEYCGDDEARESDFRPGITKVECVAKTGPLRSVITFSINGFATCAREDHIAQERVDAEVKAAILSCPQEGWIRSLDTSTNGIMVRHFFLGDKGFESCDRIAKEMVAVFRDNATPAQIASLYGNGGSLSHGLTGVTLKSYLIDTMKCNAKASRKAIVETAKRMRERSFDAMAVDIAKTLTDEEREEKDRLVFVGAFGQLYVNRCLELFDRSSKGFEIFKTQCRGSTANCSADMLRQLTRVRDEEGAAQQNFNRKYATQFRDVHCCDILPNHFSYTDQSENRCAAKHTLQR